MLRQLLLLLLLLLLLFFGTGPTFKKGGTRDVWNGIVVGARGYQSSAKHQSNFGYFRKGPFETLNKVKHARLESVERREVSHAKANKQIFRLFSEGCIHCNVLFFDQPKKKTTTT